MNNTVGLEDGRWVRIVNIGDGSVIELEGNTLVCKPPDPTRADYQVFKCILKGDGRFNIACKYQATAEHTMVWDYSRHRKLLIQKKQSNSTRNFQVWKSEHVPGSENTYFVLSAVEDTNCLKNVGQGKQVLIVRKTDQITGDKFAQWQLERLEPIRVEDKSSPVPQVQTVTPVGPPPVPPRVRPPKVPPPPIPPSVPSPTQTSVPTNASPSVTSPALPSLVPPAVPPPAVPLPASSSSVSSEQSEVPSYAPTPPAIQK